MNNSRTLRTRHLRVFLVLVAVLSLMLGTIAAASGQVAAAPKVKGATVQGTGIFNYDSTVDIHAVGVPRSYNATGYANFHTWAYGDMLGDVKCLVAQDGVATVFGIVTSATDPTFVIGFEFMVVDGTPDMVQFLFNSYQPDSCYANYPSSSFPLTTGDITITPGKKAHQ